MPEPRPMTWENIEHLAVDDDGHLYWHGTRVQTRQTISLRTWEFILAVVVALASATMAGIEAARFFLGLGM